MVEHPLGKGEVECSIHSGSTTRVLAWQESGGGRVKMRRMVRPIRSALALAIILAVMATAQAANSSLVTIKTPRGAKQAFILIAPDKPVASVILFAGGSGGLGLKSAASMKWGAGNFLVRTRDMFAADGFAVAVVDAPYDHHNGMNAIFRMSAAHASDIERLPPI